jgi:outer membrane protein
MSRRGGRLALVGLAALLAAGPASAQFANRSLGFTAGYMSLTEPTLDRGFPLGVLATFYMDDGWELTFRAHGLIVTLLTSGTQTFAFDGGAGIRKLFLQESFRPYVAGELSYLQVFMPGGGIINYAAVAPAVGFDYMLGSEISVGPRGQLNVYWMLNRSLAFAWAVTLEVAAYY